MKLNKVLALAGLALVVALPAIAAPAVLTGDVTGGWITDFTNNASQGPGFDLYVNAKIDDFNTAYANIGIAMPNTTLAAAYLTSDLGKFLKMDAKMFGWSVTAGYTSAGDNSYASQTAYGLEDATVATTATTWMINTTLSVANLINVRLGLAPLTLSSAATKDFIGGVFLAPALGTVGKVNLEAFYDSDVSTNGSIYADGRFDLTAVKGLTIGIGAGMGYALTGGDMHVAASAKATFGALGNVAAGFIMGTLTGDSTLLGVSAQLTPVAGFNVYGGAKLNLTTGAGSVFDSADFAVSYGIGATTVYLGYLVGNGTTAPTVLWAPAANTDGGLYVKATVSF